MELATDYHLKRETLHYAVNYVDRYLSRVQDVEKEKLQLVGVTALYIASKIEEVYAPKIGDYSRATDGGFSTDQIKEMEKTIAKVTLNK